VSYTQYEIGEHLEPARARFVMRKLPHVTVLFWGIKIIATTLGETAGDLLAQTLRIGYLLSTVILVGLFLISLVFQLRAGRFHAPLFWTVVALTSTAGTTLSDFMNRTGGLGYTGGALVLSTALAVVFVVWRRSGQTLDVENLATFKGELLFWIAILVSNSLGTSTGDFMSDTLGLGFRTTALILSAIMLALAVAHYRTKVNGTLLFWIAFVLTRPLGTVFGNILSKEHERGGLNFGTVWTSGALFGVLMALVAYQLVQVRRRPLRPLPVPVHRRTGHPQRPNGSLVASSAA
jgi:uncharacterized membrane-anchored protein